MSWLGLANVGRTAAGTSTRLKACQALCSCPGAALFAQAEEAQASGLELARPREQRRDGTGFASAEVLGRRGVDNQHSAARICHGPHGRTPGCPGKGPRLGRRARRLRRPPQRSRAGTNPGGEEREPERRVFTPSATHGEHRLNVWHAKARLGGRMKPKQADQAATGVNAHGHPPVQTAPDPPSADRNGRRTNAISVRGLLDVMADFDQFGARASSWLHGSCTSRRAQSRQRGRGRSPTAYSSAPEPTRCPAKRRGGSPPGGVALTRVLMTCQREALLAQCRKGHRSASGNPRSGSTDGRSPGREPRPQATYIRAWDRGNSS